MYTIIGSPRSRAGRVYWAMEEMGLDYATNPLKPGSDELRAFNPSAKSPCLMVDEDCICDSVAIVQFLADRHQQLTHPAGTIERALQDSFTQFVCDEVDGALWTAAKHSFALPEKVRVPEVKSAARFEFDRAMQVLETRLGDNEFLTGDRLTVPDIILGHCGLWAKVAKFDTPEGPVGAYFNRLYARPAFAKMLQAGAEEASLLP